MQIRPGRWLRATRQDPSRFQRGAGVLPAFAEASKLHAHKKQLFVNGDAAFAIFCA